ncbi:MAG: rhodanese-like domain-containing protein, partial [Flavisolibacter sp.]
KIRLNKVSKTQIRSLEVTLKIETISPYQLEEEFQNTYQLIDVRTHEERKQFNIGGIHIPVESIEKEITKLNYSKPLLFYCSSGKRSAIAARIIKSKYPSLKIYSLEGGLEKWNVHDE